jgi:hypothetical protein
MKTACLLLLTMSWATLTQGTGYATPMSPAPQQKSPQSSAPTATAYPGDAKRAAPADNGGYRTREKASVEQRGHGRASITNRPPSRVPLPKANRPKQLPNSRQRSLPGNAMNLHQPGSDRSRGGANGGLTRNETANNALAFGTPSAVRPTVPLLNNVPHRRPNPAMVGGSLISPRSNTGAINGTRMNRKP